MGKKKGSGRSGAKQRYLDQIYLYASGPVADRNRDSQDMVPEAYPRALISTRIHEALTSFDTGSEGINPLVVEVKKRAVVTALMADPITVTFPIGARVRWQVTTPGGPMGLLFGRVAASQPTDLAGTVRVAEETSGKIWALLPETDHVILLSKP